MSFKTNLLFVLVIFSILMLQILSFKISFSVKSCHLIYDKGSCDENLYRWWYNETSKRCEMFTYGGCDGNENNFEHERDCHRKCGVMLLQYEEYLQTYADIKAAKIVYKE